MRGEKFLSTLLIVMLILATMLTQASLLAYAQDHLIPGLVQDYVYVYRNNWGVPHV